MSDQRKATLSKKNNKVLKFACSDVWLAAVWLVWLIGVGLVLYLWRFGYDVFVLAGVTLLLAVLLLVVLYLSVTRRAWRVVLSGEASKDEKLAAVRIAWEWRKVAPLIYGMERDKLSGIYWCPGLRGFAVSDEGLDMGVQLPDGIRVDRSVWEKPATDHSMAEILRVADVLKPERVGNRVFYVVIPVDATEDERHTDVG